MFEEMLEAIRITIGIRAGGVLAYSSLALATSRRDEACQQLRGRGQFQQPRGPLKRETRGCSNFPRQRHYD